jgi:hypothetical protein
MSAFHPKRTLGGTIKTLGGTIKVSGEGAMFRVSNVRHRLLFWVSVTLNAETDMALTKQRLRFNKLHAPVIDTRVLEVKAGETFTINARTSEFKIGDRVPLDRVAHKLSISRKWQTTATA